MLRFITESLSFSKDQCVALGEATAMRCVASRQSLTVFLPGWKPQAVSVSAGQHLLTKQQKVRLPVVKMDVASVPKPGVPIRVVKGTVEGSRKQ